ncbi:MAG: hypothetical protein GY942_25115 [Aestuariibacter sp.]|nr:hypothetical protein [Aestuariibacter sp.]
MSASMPSSDMPLPKTGVATPVSSASTSGVIQRSALDDQTTTADMIDQGNAAEGTVDINEIVFEVQRQFRRELAIEGERRGATSWF